MRLLIDECVDERLRLLFPGHDCQTARFANLAGLKNGRLLEAAEAAGVKLGEHRDGSKPDIDLPPVIGQWSPGRNRCNRLE